MAVKSNWNKWLTEEQEIGKRAERGMAQVVLFRSRMLAPVMTGDLADSGRVEQNPNGGVTVTFGSPSVPYARRRHYENERNPQTLHYLKRGGDSVAKENVRKYVDLSR